MNMQEETWANDVRRRREDIPLITGRGQYVDDLKPPAGRPPALHLAFTRSMYGHATIQNIDLTAAQALPGVTAAYTGAELIEQMPAVDILAVKDMNNSKRRPMAEHKVRYVGDPVACVLADSAYTALDASELVEVDYAPLPAIMDLEAALAPDAPLLYEELGTNRAFNVPAIYGNVEEAFAKADHTVSLRLVNQRLAPSSIEPRGCLFDFDSATGQLSGWVSTQSVYRVRDMLAQMLGFDRSHIRIYNADVGGAFGAKNGSLGEEIIAASLAMKYSRPIKWMEGRSENLQAQVQGRGQIDYVEAAFQHDGRLLGLKVHIFADMGAYLSLFSAFIPVRVVSFLCGPYQVQAIDSQVIGVYTNKANTAAYRGAGRPEGTYILERVMNRIALELQLDPVEVRRRNLLTPDAFPYKTITGVTYDSGNYQRALDKALELADYTGWRDKQRVRRENHDTKLLGVGIATFNELSGNSFVTAPGAPREAATVRIQPDGSILVQSGSSHNGQGHFTTFAQIAASVLAVPFDQVHVQMNDSALPSFSQGTIGSRMTQVGGSAILLASEAVREKALQVAAQVLEVAPNDLSIEQGQVSVRGVPTRTIGLGELARLVEEQPDLISHEDPNPYNKTPIEGLAAWRDFDPPGPSYASGAHVAIVEIDSDTGEVAILTYVAVDDCGHIINHYLVDGQLHGSLAQGIGQALYEEVVYDEEGQLLTSTFMDYAMPIAGQIPNFTLGLVETPSPTNPLGAKGIGESGCVGAPPTIVNAVLDALAPLGVKSIDMPLKPEKVWALIHTASA